MTPRLVVESSSAVRCARSFIVSNGLAEAFILLVFGAAIEYWFGAWALELPIASNSATMSLAASLVVAVGFVSLIVPQVPMWVWSPTVSIRLMGSIVVLFGLSGAFTVAYLLAQLGGGPSLRAWSYVLAFSMLGTALGGMLAGIGLPLIVVFGGAMGPDYSTWGRPWLEIVSVRSWFDSAAANPWLDWAAPIFLVVSFVVLIVRIPRVWGVQATG